MFSTFLQASRKYENIFFGGQEHAQYKSKKFIL